MAAKLGFGGCGKACKADGFVDPPPICLSNPRRRSHCAPWNHSVQGFVSKRHQFLPLRKNFPQVQKLAKSILFHVLPLVKVYMGKPGELFAKKPMVGEAGYKVVELSMPWPLSIACQVESRPVGVTIADTQRQRQRISAFL